MACLSPASWILCLITKFFGDEGPFLLSISVFVHPICRNWCLICQCVLLHSVHGLLFWGVFFTREFFSQGEKNPVYLDVAIESTIILLGSILVLLGSIQLLSLSYWQKINLTKSQSVIEVTRFAKWEILPCLTALL